MSSEKRKVVIVGTGGHARVIISLLEGLERWQIVGLLDREFGATEEDIGGYKIIGSWKDIQPTRERAGHAVVAVGDNEERKGLYHSFRKAAFELPTLIHPTAYLDRSARLGDGCVVCMGALVGANATVGSNTIVNSGSIVDHECRLEDHVHIAPGVRLAGRVVVGEGTFVGIGTSVIDKVKIGKGVIVGAGSVVVSDLPNNVVAYGVPARVRRGKSR
ncbi:MAG: acetyltransferase [Deltaproteobacteria bacterium]|nr:acetyltransferase [Deltaproteobacteria bacterium]